MKHKFVLTVFLSLSLISQVFPQSATDSLKLNDAIKTAIAASNSIKQASSSLEAGLARVEQSKSSLYPDANVSLNYTWISPIPAFVMPGLGSIGLAPNNNWDEHVSVSATLYDFGRREKNIDFAGSQIAGGKDKIELIKHQLAYATVQNFYAIIFLKKSIGVQSEQINTLKKHLDWTKKKVDAGTATNFDLLTTNVRISAAESYKITLENSLKTAEINLRRLMGLPSNTPVNPEGGFDSAPVNINTDSLLSAAFRSRYELKLADDQINVARAQYDAASVINNPSLNVAAIYGFKNGYEPNIYSWRGNFVFAAQILIPVSKFVPYFGGHKEENLQQEATANFQAATFYRKDLTEQIKSEIDKAASDINSSRERIATTEAAIKQAENALELARTKYEAGTVTNLDLLDAETSLAQSKLMRLEAFYKYTLGIYELKQAAGEIIWQ